MFYTLIMHIHARKRWHSFLLANTPPFRGMLRVLRTE